VGKPDTFSPERLGGRDDWLRQLADGNAATLLVYDHEGVLYANPAVERLTGYAAAELVGRDVFWQLIAADERVAVRARMCAWLDGQRGPRCQELRLVHRDGRTRQVEMSVTTIRFGDRPAGLATLIDVTAYRQAEAVTLAAVGDGVIRTDARGRIDYLNPVAERLTGYSLAEARGRRVGEIYRVVAESTQQGRNDPISVCLAEKRAVASPGLFTLKGRGGHELTVRDTVLPILDHDDSVIGAVLVFHDLTELRGLEREMAYLASHDALTGLLNRLELEIHLEAALEAARERQTRYVLLFLDVQQFKLINDACGHLAGDELLCQVARLLNGTVGEEGVLARVGGDEFAVLLENTTMARAREIAGAIQQAVREYRFTWAGQVFEISVAIGLVPITARSESVVQVLKAADTACFLARESGTNRIHEHRSRDVAAAARHGQAKWVQRIRRALAEDRFCLYHQRIRPLAPADPRRDMHEILLRMVGAEGASVEPAHFIPVAEHYRLAPVIDRWVVRQSLRLLSQGAATLADRPVSINLSGQSLGDETFLGYVVERIEASGLPTERLCFEITETAAVADLERAVAFIDALKGIGCRFILDDFGSGLSSFAYLKDLPVDLIKIDGEFVRSLETDPMRREIVRAIHQIGRTMGLQTIAEWVETESTYDLLCQLEIDFAQGFYVHRPEPIDEETCRLRSESFRR